jgi:hypothetical protein
MLKRALACSAQDVVLSIELARRGAGTTLITELTGFGARFVRQIVRGHGGTTGRANDSRIWFQQDPHRLVHGRLLLQAYELQPSSYTPGQRLLAAYDAYRESACQPGVLGLQHCYNLVQLYQKGEVAHRNCGQCRLPYLILSERTVCPVCYTVGRVFCLGCGTYLRLSDATIARGRRYCDECAPQKRRVRRSNQSLVVRSTRMRSPLVGHNPAMARNEIAEA